MIADPVGVEETAENMAWGDNAAQAPLGKDFCPSKTNQKQTH